MLDKDQVSLKVLLTEDLAEEGVIGVLKLPSEEGCGFYFHSVRGLVNEIPSFWICTHKAKTL